MTDSPDAIRADIERTRADLGSDVDALADKVSPSSIAHRQSTKLRSAVSGAKDKIFGADSPSSSGSHRSVADGMSDAKDTVVAKAEGNPLAVGLIAFGAGLLIASLIPASRAEKRVAGVVREKAQPLVDEAAGVAKEVADDLKEPAQDAAASVKDAATDAVDHVKGDAQTAADDVKGQAQDASHRVSDS